MNAIIDKVRDGDFRTASCAFDPTDDDGHDWTDGKPSARKLGIPDFMLEPVRPSLRDARIAKRA